MKFLDVVTEIHNYALKEKKRQDARVKQAKDRAERLTRNKSNKQVYEMYKAASGLEKAALMVIYKNRCESENKR